MAPAPASDAAKAVGATQTIASMAAIPRGRPWRRAWDMTRSSCELRGSETGDRIRTHVRDVAESGRTVPEGVQDVIAEDVVRLLLAPVRSCDIEDATALADAVAHQPDQH